MANEEYPYEGPEVVASPKQNSLKSKKFKKSPQREKKLPFSSHAKALKIYNDPLPTPKLHNRS